MRQHVRDLKRKAKLIQDKEGTYDWKRILKKIFLVKSAFYLLIFDFPKNIKINQDYEQTSTRTQPNRAFGRSKRKPVEYSGILGTWTGDMSHGMGRSVGGRGRR